MLPVDRRRPSDLLFCLRWAGPVLSRCRLHFQKIQDMDYMTHDTYYTTRRLQYLGLVFIYTLWLIFFDILILFSL